MRATRHAVSQASAGPLPACRRRHPLGTIRCPDDDARLHDVVASPGCAPISPGPLVPPDPPRRRVVHCPACLVMVPLGSRSRHCDGDGMAPRAQQPSMTRAAIASSALGLPLDVCLGCHTLRHRPATPMPRRARLGHISPDRYHDSRHRERHGPRRCCCTFTPSACGAAFGVAGRGAPRGSEPFRTARRLSIGKWRPSTPSGRDKVAAEVPVPPPNGSVPTSRILRPASRRLQRPSAPGPTRVRGRSCTGRWIARRALIRSGQAHFCRAAGRHMFCADFSIRDSSSPDLAAKAPPSPILRLYDGIICSQWHRRREWPA